MIYFFMLAIFVGLIGVGVLALYLMDRVHKIEKQTARSGGAPGAGGAFGTTDPQFEGLGGQGLWERMSAPDAAAGGADANAQLRHRYAQVLQRHIEELFEEGMLDGRQGVRMPPDPVRVIKTAGGQVASWLPPAESHEIYEIGLERSVSGATGFAALRPRLGRVCERLYEKASLEMMPQLFDHLLPGAGNGAAHLPAQGGGQRADEGAVEGAGHGNETVVEVIKKM